MVVAKLSQSFCSNLGLVPEDYIQGGREKPGSFFRILCVYVIGLRGWEKERGRQRQKGGRERNYREGKRRGKERGRGRVLINNPILLPAVANTSIYNAILPHGVASVSTPSPRWRACNQEVGFVWLTAAGTRTLGSHGGVLTQRC